MIRGSVVNAGLGPSDLMVLGGPGSGWFGFNRVCLEAMIPGVWTSRVMALGGSHWRVMGLFLPLMPDYPGGAVKPSESHSGAFE